MFNPSTIKEFQTILETSFHSKNDTPPITSFNYAIYLRKSTEDELKQVKSIPDQLIECRAYAERIGLPWKDKNIIAETASAKQADRRPKFRKMLNDIKLGKYDAILAWHPDRLSRNMKEAGEIIELIDTGEIKDLKFVSSTFENSPSGKMMLGIFFVLSKEYSDKLSVDVSRGNKHSVEKGFCINKSKHGYIKVGTEQYLRPDGRNFDLIKDAFRMRVERKTLEEIADYLVKNDYSRATNATTKRYTSMDKKKISKVLTDTFYTGLYIYGKNKVVNLIEQYDFEPAVSFEDFKKINNLSEDSRFMKLFRNYKKDTIKANLMRGMITCAECGNSMSSGLTIKKSKVEGKDDTRYFYYRCDTVDCSNTQNLRPNVIIKYICEYLEGKPFSSEASHTSYLKEMKREAKVKGEEDTRALFSLRAKKGVLGAKLEQSKQALAGEKLESIKDLFREDIKNHQMNLLQIDTDIETLEVAIASNKPTISEYKDFLELMENLPKYIRGEDDMEVLDFYIRKIFSNFTITNGNVSNSTLSSPFDKLENINVSKGGR